MVTMARSRDESTLLYIIQTGRYAAGLLGLSRAGTGFMSKRLVKNIKEQALWDSCEDLHANSLGLVSDSALARTADGPRLW